MAKRKKSKSSNSKLSLVTPKGALQWAKFFKPETKFNPDGVYSTDLVLDYSDPEVKKMCDAIVEFREEQDAGDKLPFKLDKDAGTITLRAKCAAKVDGKARKVPVVDAKKTPIEEDPGIGNGSIAKLSVTFVPYEQQGGGITCYLGAVQLLEVKQYNPGVDAFDEEEGYEYGSDSDIDSVDNEPGGAISDSGTSEEGGVNDGDEEF